MIGLFCKRAIKKRRYSAEETYDFKEPTNRSHPILIYVLLIHACVYVDMCILIFVYIYIYIICVCRYLYIYKYIYVHMLYGHIRVRIYIYMHIWV